VYFILAGTFITRIHVYFVLVIIPNTWIHVYFIFDETIIIGIDVLYYVLELKP